MVCVFARKTSEPLTSLVKQIDKKIGENDKLKGFVVVLTQKGEETADSLRTLAKDAGIRNVPLTIHQDAAELPDYELAKDADVTVTMWSDGKVKSSRGFKGALTDRDVDTIVSDIPKLLND